jgi:hypothetical protein
VDIVNIMTVKDDAGADVRNAVNKLKSGAQHIPKALPT